MVAVFQTFPNLPRLSIYGKFTTNASVSRSIKNTFKKKGSTVLKPQSQPPSSLGLCGQPFFPLTYTHINKALMIFLASSHPLVSFQPCGDVRLHLAPQNLAKRPGWEARKQRNARATATASSFGGVFFPTKKTAGVDTQFICRLKKGEKFRFQIT